MRGTVFYRPFQLVSRNILTEGSSDESGRIIRLTFRLESADAVLSNEGLPNVVVKVRAPNSYLRFRAYSVASPPEARGEFTLVVKVYNGGRVSPYLNTIPVGDMVYFSKAHALKPKRMLPPSEASTVILVAFGVGISEILPIAAFYLKGIVADRHGGPSSKSRRGAKRPAVVLVYAVKKKEDLVLLDELAELAAVYNSTAAVTAGHEPPPPQQQQQQQFQLRVVLSREDRASPPEVANWVHDRLGPHLLSEWFGNSLYQGKTRHEVAVKVVGTKAMMKATYRYFNALGIKGRI